MPKLEVVEQLRSLITTLKRHNFSRGEALSLVTDFVIREYCLENPASDLIEDPVKVEEVTPPSSIEHTLTDDQRLAWQKLNAFLALPADKAPIFVLKGFAGTGKSYLMKMLLTLPHNFVFSAPTNKASKVLSTFLDLPVRTTYSVLGLRMTADEDKMVLTTNESPDLGSNPVLVIDEAGMVPKFMADLLREACAAKDWRIIFVGDPAQWNPIGETSSAVWRMAPPEHRAMLREVKRFENEILSLSVEVRSKLKYRDYSIRIRSKGSVRVLNKHDFLKEIKGLPLESWSDTKVAAWRNSTVDGYNQMIRKALGFKNQYEPNELVLMGAPLVSDGAILAHTDEELRVLSVESRTFTFPEGEIAAYVLSLMDRSFTLFVPKDPGVLQAFLSKRASVASSLTGAHRKQAWAAFWDLKNTFQSVRYGYAMTTHRLQGSTVDHIFVDQQDILANGNKRESFRGLYVAATRPRLSFTTY